MHHNVFKRFLLNWNRSYTNEKNISTCLLGILVPNPWMHLACTWDSWPSSPRSGIRITEELLNRFAEETMVAGWWARVGKSFSGSDRQGEITWEIEQKRANVGVAGERRSLVAVCKWTRPWRPWTSGSASALRRHVNDLHALSTDRHSHPVPTQTH